MVSKNLLIIAIALLGTLNLSAQDPAHRVIDSRNGLASNSVRSLAQDEDGYMWFFTDKGASRYDGAEIRNFTFPNEIYDPNVTIFGRDTSGHLMFVHHQNKLSFIRAGEIHTYPFNQIIADSLSRSSIKSICFDSLNNLWIGLLSSDTSCIASISVNGAFEWYNTRYDQCLSYVKTFKNSWVYGSHFHNVNEQLNGTINERDSTLIIEDQDNIRTLTQPHLLPPSYWQANGEELLLVPKHGGYTIKKSGILEQFDSSGSIVRHLPSSFDDGLFFKSFTNSVLKYTQNLNAHPVDTLFKGHLISGMIQDTDGNYWFSSFINGVYYVPSLQSIKYRHPGASENSLIRGMTLFRDTLILGYADGTVSFIGSKDQKMKISSIEVGTKIYSLKSLSTGQPAFGLTDPNLKDNFIKRNRFITLKGRLDALTKRSNGNLLVARAKEVIEVYSGRNGKEKLLNLEGSTKALISLAEGQFLYSNSKGVFSCTAGRVAQLGLLDNRLNSPCLDFCKLDYDWTAMSSVKHGILFMKGENIVQLDTSNGMLSNLCRQLFLDNEKNLWVLTDEGLNRLNLDITHDKLAENEVKSIGLHNGLITKDIKHFVVDDKYIWFTSTSDLYRINKGSISEGEAIVNVKTHIDHMSHNGMRYTTLDTPTIAYGSGPIQVQFSCIFFNDHNSVTYQYQLEDDNMRWFPTTSPTVVYDNLLPGVYTFKVRAWHDSGVSRSNTASFNFMVSTPFWRTTTFIVSCCILCTLSIYIFITILVQRVKRRARFVQTAISYKDRALRAQMNPHFIYNTLNSIQSYIMKNDRQKSTEHLVKFSRLVRAVFDNSSRELVTLKEELNTISLYMDLEMIRFNEKVEFVKNIDQEIDLTTHLMPPMLLQPLLENALIHGVLPKTSGGKGRVELRVEKRDTHLLFSVADNGDEATIRNDVNSDREGGTKITFERIERFNAESNHKGFVDIISEAKNGTKVIFSLKTRTAS